MCPIQFLTNLIFLDYTDGIFWSKVENQLQQSIYLFQPILNMKCVRRLPTLTLL